jgi:hypothetical protein
LAALVPKPRVNLTRYHGVLAPNHRWRGLVTPARRGKGIKSTSNAEVRTPAERHTAMTWAQRLKRVFNIDMPQGTLSWRFAPIHLVEVCSLCGGSARVIACIEDQDVIDRDPDSRAPERVGNADPAAAGATDQSAAWDKVNRREASREGALGYIAAFRREGLRPIASKEAIENRMA